MQVSCVYIVYSCWSKQVAECMMSRSLYLRVYSLRSRQIHASICLRVYNCIVYSCWFKQKTTSTYLLGFDGCRSNSKVPAQEAAYGLVGFTYNVLDVHGEPGISLQVIPSVCGHGACAGGS